MEGKNQRRVLKESDYDSAHVLSPILTNVNNNEASKKKYGKKKNKKKTKQKKENKGKQGDDGDGVNNNDEEESVELQEEARMEGGFDSATVSSLILTNAENSEASIKKSRRKCKKKEETEEKYEKEKRKTRTTRRPPDATPGGGCYLAHWLLCMMILLVLCQGVEAVGEAVGEIPSLRQRMMGVLAAGTCLTLAAITAALLKQGVRLTSREEIEAQTILEDHRLKIQKETDWTKFALRMIKHENMPPTFEALGRKIDERLGEGKGNQARRFASAALQDYIASQNKKEKDEDGEEDDSSISFGGSYDP